MSKTTESKTFKQLKAVMTDVNGDNRQIIKMPLHQNLWAKSGSGSSPTNSGEEAHFFPNRQKPCLLQVLAAVKRQTE